MPLKTALKYLTYSLITTPISPERTFPGNIGEGINRDANVNIKKKTMSIDTSLILNYLSDKCASLLWCILV